MGSEGAWTRTAEEMAELKAKARLSAETGGSAAASTSRRRTRTVAVLKPSRDLPAKPEDGAELGSWTDATRRRWPRTPCRRGPKGAAPFAAGGCRGLIGREVALAP